MSAEIGAAAISGGSSLLGSILGYAGQRSANKTNLKIARETNELNRQLVEATNKQQLDIFNRQLEYNSPVQQRKMLEAAGYNPANLYTGSNASVSSPSAPSLTPPQYQRAEVQPYLGFSQDLAVMGQNLAALASAKKEYEESKKTSLENSVFMERMKLEFDRLGLQNKWQEIENQFGKDSFSARLDKVLNEADISLEEKNRLHMQNALFEIYGEREYKAKIDNLEKQAKLWKEQGKTEITKQDLNNALGKKAISEAALARVEAWYKQYIAESERERNFKQARSSDAMAVALDASTRVFKKFGEGEAAARILKMLKEGDYSEAATEKAWKEVQKLNKDIDWYEFHEAVDGLKVISNSFLGALFLAK